MRKTVVGWLVLGALSAAWSRSTAQVPQTPPHGVLLRRDIAAAIPQLQRLIALRLEGVSLDDALRTVARAAGLPLTYNDAILPRNRKVWLTAVEIRTEAALEEILRNSGLQLLPLATGQVVVVKAQAGGVAGRVTDASTQQGVSGVRVFLERTRWGTTTDSAGGYRLAEVAPGAYTLVARRIGYRPHTQRVTVEADRETTVDVALQSAPSDLDAVVVTATGEQRLLELGHTVGRINADSLVREAPVSSLSELLTARVPGLQVFQTQGTVGGRVNLLMRGPNSFNVINEPIFIVDGIRYTTAERTPFGFSGAGGTEPTSPLNDLNPNDIESIDVVKGPSAATLYGTDAANGVIVITTKRGRPGPARWSAYANATTSNVPTGRMPDIWWGWGTVNGIPNNPNLSCTLERKASGECTQQDSVTRLRIPLKDPRFSIFASKPTYGSGLNVSGGAPDLRYYFSADITDATGAIQMPPAFVDQVRQRLGLAELPEEWRNPNSARNLNLRSNVSALLGRTLDLRVNAGYIRSSTNALTFLGDVYPLAFSRTTPATAETQPYASRGRDPGGAFARSSTDDVDRFVTSASGEFRPVGWFSTRATLGLDVLTSQKHALARQGDQPLSSALRTGEVEDTRTRQLTTTADIVARVTARSGRLSTRTAVGSQYTRTLFDVVGVFGRGLAPGQTSVPGALLEFNAYDYRESAVLGGYVEETLGLNDRLFLTGAVRVDGASAFGRDFEAAVYPRLGASWLVTAEPFVPRIPGLDELRLRFALGAAGLQANPAQSRPGYQLGTGIVDGQSQQLYQLTGLGNPELRPERTREHEFGFDGTALGGRLTLGVTRFSRRTTDQIVDIPLPSGLGFISENLGLTTQSGFEARISARVLDHRAVSLDLAFQHSYHTTKVLDLGRGLGTEFNTLWGGYRVGYPLGARFFTPIKSWNDANGDGALTFSEVELDTLTYMGESFPPRTQTLTMVLGLLDRRVRVSALLERKSGFTQMDPFQCAGGTACREAVDWNTPLEVQARLFFPTLPQPGDFTRLQEVTVAADLSASLTRLARLNSVTVAVSGRNLALWSKFTGPDPNVRGPNVNGIGAYNVFRGGEASGIPLSRSYSFRVSIAF